MSVRAKIFWSSFLLSSIFGLLCIVMLRLSVQQWLDDQVRKEMHRHAENVRFWLERHQHPISDQEWRRILPKLAHRLGGRITLIRKDGTVWADSAFFPPHHPPLGNHAQRPEVLAAWKNGEGFQQRTSHTVGETLWYLATTYRRNQKRGVLRVAIAQSDVEVSLGRIQATLLVVALIALVFVLFMSVWISHLMSRTLRPLVETAKAKAHGHHNDDTNPIHFDLQELSPKNATSHEKSLSLGTTSFRGSLRDVTEEIEWSVETLASERDRFVALLDSLHSAVIAISNEGILYWFNQAAHDFFHEGDIPIGKTLAECMPSQDLQELLGQARSGMTCNAEFDLKQPHRRSVQALITPLSSTGGYVLLLNDVTELRRLETIRRDFVANVSHELRTPLSIIRANAETLLDGALEEKDVAKDFLEAVLNHAERLSLLVNDLLELSKIEANRYPLRTEQLELSSIIHRVVSSLRTKITHKSLTLSEQLEHGLTVTADLQALEQILLNLIDNAVKYTPADGHIVVRAFQQQQHVHVEIEDNGPGIPKKHHSRIFERFYRVDTGRSRQQGGTGLGLAIVRNLVEILDGHVGLRPGTTQGSVFWFSLPVQQTQEEQLLTDEELDDL